MGCGKDGKETKSTTTEKTAPKTTENQSSNQTANSSSGQSSNSSAGQSLSYEVVNNTGETLVDVFVTPAETNNWGKDILPNDVFPNGATMKVTIPPDYGETCMFDMKITDTEGGHITFTNVDICKIIKLQINGDATFEYLTLK